VVYLISSPNDIFITVNILCCGAPATTALFPAGPMLLRVPAIP
jgi:hypothetical protein